MSGVTLERVLHWFERISAEPRASGQEERISTVLKEYAERAGLSVTQDEAWNLLIRKPAHRGQEDRPPLILQAHLDMVAAAVAGSTHDFATDPIRIIRDGDELRAEGTTLGADDGIGVSIALAILDGDEVRHPDLEVLLTTGEESGLLGAKALAPGVLRGRYLLNLDGEQDGVFLTSCAGGATYDVTFPLGPRQRLAPAYDVQLTGLAGGHSGLDIDKGRANAIRTVVQLLADLSGRSEGGAPGAPAADGNDVRLALFDAPGAFNAISREARVVFACAADHVTAAIAACQDRLVESETTASVTIRILDDGADCLDADAGAAILGFLAAVPDGVHTMSEHLPGLVESSLNTGVVRQGEDTLTVTLSTRSADVGRHAELRAAIEALAARHGGSVRVYGEYPAWPFDPDNPLLPQAVRVYEGLFGAAPVVTGVHGGLECGVLSAANPGVAMLSVGADLTDCHTPAERADVPSIERLTRLVVTLVEEVR